jgi:hypothetical protein
MSSSAPLSGTDFLAKPRKLVLQLIGLAAKNIPNIISKLEERIDRHRSKIAFDHFPPPTRRQLVGHHCGIATVPMLVLWLCTQGREANTGAIASP